MLNFVVGAFLVLLFLLMCFGVFVGMTAKRRDSIPEGLGIALAALVGMYLVTWIASWFGWRP